MPTKHTPQNKNIYGILRASLILFLLLPLLLFARTAGAVDVALQWDPSPDENIATYRIYYGTASSTYSWYEDAGDVVTHTVRNLDVGRTYYFSATAVSATNVESSHSNEVSYTTCTYDISPAQASFSSAGGTGTVSVLTQSGCTWTASSGTSWLTITSGSSGTGSGTVVYAVSENSTLSTRSGNATMAGKTFAATQEAASPSNYTLSITKSGTGSGTVTTNPTGTSFAQGTSVTLTAAADTNSTFTGWSGACSGTSTTCTVTMNSNLSVTASFALKTYTISASAGTGGSISPTGSVSVNHGSSQSFTITPASGYTIGTVTVDGSSVGAVTSYTFSNVTANRTISATFTATPQQYTLSITKSGTGAGTVTTSPTGTSFAPGTSVKLTAKADASSTFKGWSGACTGTLSSCTVKMNSNLSVTASFALKTYTISASAGTGGSISPAGYVSVHHGSDQSFTITPKIGYRVRYVVVNGRNVGAVTSYTFYNVKAKQSIKAYFIRY